MSTILDALRKSESERKQGFQQARGVNASFYGTHSKMGNTRLAWGLGLLVSVNMLVLFFLFWEKIMGVSNSPSQSPVTSEQEMIHEHDGAINTRKILRERPIETPGQASLSLAPSEPQRVKPPKEHNIISPSLNSPSTQTTSELIEKDEVPSLGELSRQFQSRIPSLKFNSHIYADDPTARRVMINNLYLREGQQVEGLGIVEITKEGVIFRLDDQVFEVNVINGWSN